MERLWKHVNFDCDEQPPEASTARPATDLVEVQSQDDPRSEEEWDRKLGEASWDPLCLIFPLTDEEGDVGEELPDTADVTQEWWEGE